MTTNISDEQLLELNKQGLIPGPYETNYQFLSRVKDLLRFSNCIEEYLENHSPILAFRINDQIPMQDRKISLSAAENIFDIKPKWVPAFYSDHSLSFWHGGCAYIPDRNEDSQMVFIQLRTAFRRSPRYLWIYDRSEILAHESAHIGRVAFNEPTFEELIACQCSSSILRRWLGPSITSSRQIKTLIASTTFIIMIDWTLVFFQKYAWYMKAMYLKLFPGIIILFILWRAWKLQKTFSSCLRNLTSLLEDKGKAFAVAYRLTDNEIYRFSKASPQSIMQYAQKNKSSSLRWRLIAKAYFYL